ncbi:Aliphatic sulfonates import ATP-binding protein SsuB [subsurface metagenome]
MVFQELNQLLPWKTVKENILFGLVTGNSQSEKSVEDLISIVGLEKFENYYPHQLSGGMKQRVALARALFMNPSLLLMDEPFGSLDAQTRRTMRAELLRIWEKLRTTVIFVTHNIRESIQLADRVIVLSKQGEVKADITIDLPRPRDVTSHGFGGYWNKILSFMEVK